MKADFYVSPDGNDNWSGRLECPNASKTDGPFATLTRARDAVREMKERGLKKDFLVLIRGGTYYLRETIVFSLEDSAPDGHKITYAAYPGEEPVFSSGVKISGWKELGRNRPEGLSEMAAAHVWVANVPEPLNRFYTLYDGDRRLPRARSNGFNPTEPPLPWDFLYQKNPEPFYTLAFPKGAIKNWENLEDVEIVIRPNVPFTMNILPLESVDEDRCLARTSVPGGYPLRVVTGGIKSGEKTVWVENVLEALDTPGEWVLNSRERKIYLWPIRDEPGDQIYAPCLTELVRVEGDIDFDGPTDTPVRGIVFKGLTFTQADRKVVTKDDVAIQHDWEMIDKGDALLRFRGAEDCAVENCRFTNSGGSGIRLDLYCQRIRVVGNEISHLGGSGILLIGYGPGTKDVNKQNEIMNNHIHHCGEIYWHSHGIVIWQSGENRVAHNCIHHMPRKGILLSGARPWFFDPDRGTIREIAKSIRWHEIKNSEAVKACAKRIGWDRDPEVREWPELMPYLHARNNIVEYNELYRCGEILGDGAIINITGAGEGNIIRRNYIHHIFNPNLHGVIRIDDFQRGTLIEENVIFKTNSFGGALVLRHENYAVNNVVCDARPGCYIWIGWRPFDGSRIVGNIFVHPGEEQGFYASTGALDVFQHLGRMEKGEIDRNIYYNLKSPDKPTVLEKLHAVGHEKNGAYTDPLFIDWENGDFRLKPDSPALKMGIKSIDLRNVGLTKRHTDSHKN